MSGVGVKSNKRTIQNISVCKGAIIQRHKPSPRGRALWTLATLAVKGEVFRVELVCSKLGKIIKGGNSSHGTLFHVTNAILQELPRNLWPLTESYEKRAKEHQ